MSFSRLALSPEPYLRGLWVYPFYEIKCDKKILQYKIKDGLPLCRIIQSVKFDLFRAAELCEYIYNSVKKCNIK